MINASKSITLSAIDIKTKENENKTALNCASYDIKVNINMSNSFSL